jgi:hypothetical protein
MRRAKHAIPRASFFFLLLKRGLPLVSGATPVPQRKMKKEEKRWVMAASQRLVERSAENGEVFWRNGDQL